MVPYSGVLLFVFRESLLAALQQVQSTDSNEEPGSEEPKSDAQGSIPSLAVPGNGPTGPKRAETFSGFDSKLKPDNINRASSMRVPERPGIGFPSRQLPGTVSPVVGGSPKIKHKRKTSGSGWPFMTKSNSKEDKEQGGTIGTGRVGVQRGKRILQIVVYLASVSHQQIRAKRFMKPVVNLWVTGGFAYVRRRGGGGEGKALLSLLRVLSKN